MGQTLFPYHQVGQAQQVVTSDQRFGNLLPHVVAMLPPRPKQGRPLLLASAEASSLLSGQASARQTVKHLPNGGRGHRLRAQSHVRMKLRSK